MLGPPAAAGAVPERRRAEAWSTTGRPRSTRRRPASPPTRDRPVDWVATTRAAGRLSYQRDVETAGGVPAAAPRQTVPLILVRHASAGSKSDWHRGDEPRPLDSRGKQQTPSCWPRCCAASGLAGCSARRPSAAWPRSGRTRGPSARRCESRARPAERQGRRPRCGRSAAAEVVGASWRASSSPPSSARTGRTYRRCWRQPAPGSGHQPARRTAAAQGRVPGAAPGGGTLAAQERYHGRTLGVVPPRLGGLAGSQSSVGGSEPSRISSQRLTSTPAPPL